MLDFLINTRLKGFSCTLIFMKQAHLTKTPIDLTLSVSIETTDFTR